MKRKGKTPTQTPQDVQETQPLLPENSTQEKDSPRTLAHGFGQAASAQSVANNYDDRFAGGKKSAYNQRFTEEKPITQGELATFLQGLNGSMPLIISKSAQWDQEAIDNHTKNRDHDTKPLVVEALDFGCGEGRSLGLWIHAAQRLQEYGITLRVKAYDISIGGINSYKSRLTGDLPAEYFETMRNKSGVENVPNSDKIYHFDADKFPCSDDYKILRSVYGDEAINQIQAKPIFKKLAKQELKEIYAESAEFFANGKVKKCGVFKHNNLEIEFLHGLPEASPQDLKDAVKSVDMSLILFGSTSHIFPSELRQEFFKAMFDVTQGYVVATLPGYGSFQDRLRESKTEVMKTVLNQMGFKEGEIFYSAEINGEKRLFPYALYENPEAVAEVAKESGARDAEVMVSSAAHPTKVSNSRMWAAYDYVVGKALNFAIRNFRENMPNSVFENVSYYGLNATQKDQGQNEKDAAKVQPHIDPTHNHHGGSRF